MLPTDELVAYLEDVPRGTAWLEEWGLRNPSRGHRNLVNLAETGIPLDLLAGLCGRLALELPRSADPDMALNNLDRFAQASRSPLSLVALFERDPRALTELLQILATSQHQSDLLIADPSSFDRLRLTDGVALPREEVIDEALNEVRCYFNERSASRLLHAFKQREMARITYGDLIRGQRLQVVTRQLSYLADAVCEAALWLARAQLESRYGVPRDEAGRASGFTILGLGKLGGLELNYSSDIDLVFMYGADGVTDGARSISNAEYFQRLGRGVMQALTETSEYGVLYRVDLRLRPEGRQGPLVVSEEVARQYYETKGRTWERQAWLKARTVAGDLLLGERLLAFLEPWIYRKFLSAGDILDIKALKRQIERKAIRAGTEQHDVKVGLGGIRDIEFVIQYLQLLNGGELKALRTVNTLDAISRLEMCGCLTQQERGILEDNYVFLRKVEHFLQIMFDRQTHALPDDDHERQKLAIRMGFALGEGSSPLERFDASLAERRRLNRRILDHILHETFRETEPVRAEADLILMPEPAPEQVAAILTKFGFADPPRAYEQLLTLATEEIRFLSDARCRRVLAAIAQPLLTEISTTPDPDATLVQLSRVSGSLGGKGTLWELFSTHQASLQLYVRLCAAAPYLSRILTSHPGMIDELMDSLMLGRLPTREEVAKSLEERCRGAEDIVPILHGFKDSMHLQVGVRDILMKDDIHATTQTLSDIADACLHQVVETEYRKLVGKHGHPRRSASVALGPTRDDGRTDVCDLVILGLGKLGGREPNYHSDLDVVFLYEQDGTTRHERQEGTKSITSNHHFFSELSQRVIRVISLLGPLGRLYEMDARLRPTGRSGALAIGLEEFSRYFEEGRGQLWERQALCKARVVYGSPAFRQRVLDAVRRIVTAPEWDPHFAAQIHEMRMQLESTASPWNLKRGPGGTVDIEFLVQLHQLRFGGRDPSILETNTIQAIAALRAAGYLEIVEAEHLDRAYRFMRSVEARIRLMDSPGRHELPEKPGELAKLAYLLRDPRADTLVSRCHKLMEQNRTHYLNTVHRLSNEGRVARPDSFSGNIDRQEPPGTEPA
ncbi:MAG TPA: bifunctional [glutamate--ammonia ligase]-adenylyl-L-tyrosine phosphorylase/[glutamate--ammonia-ligase] adenylyltransferase [Pirellulaceae bacterium]